MNAEQIRDEYLAKAREEARVSGRDIEVTSLAFAQASVRIAELEGARAKAMEGAAPEFAESFETLAFSGWHKIVAIPGNQRKAIAIELDRRSDVIAAQAAELERLRAENQELSDQFITNAQRLGSVCYSWHKWAVEIVGKEAARRMSGQDMRAEILRRLANLDRAPAQAEPQDGGK